MIDTLLILGPFLAGVREGFVDYTYPPLERYRSPLSAEELRWRVLPPDSEGRYVFPLDTSLLKAAGDEHGLAGLNILFYVKARVRLETSGVYLVRGKWVGSLKVGNRRFALNYYGDREGLAYLRDGDTLEFRVGGLGGVRPFELTFRKAPDTPFVYEEDLTLPDLIKGELYRGYVGITLANPTLKTVSVNVNGRDYRLPPLTFLKVPVRISLKAPARVGSTQVSVYINGKPHRLKLAVKTHSADYVRRTFLSEVDSSVQYYALKFPRGFNPRRRYGLVLSLHGAAVKAENRCKAHEHREREIVVCPTNRRRWGFDWEDWGRVDALEALREVRRTFRIDERGIFLMGTSMGGHGVWHLCTSYPSLWRACMPAAAWLSIDLYVPTHMQRYRLFGKTPFVELQERLYQQSRTTQLFINLRNLPVVVLQGGKDRNVPPFHALLAADLLTRFGVVHRLVWRAEKGHWWDGSLDDGEMWRYAYRLKVRAEKRWFYTYDLSVSDSAFGVRILEVERPFYRAGFVYEKRGRTLVLKTENVKSLAIKDFRGKVIIDGDTLRYGGGVLVKFRRWKNLNRYAYRRPVLFRDAFMKPFVIVYSTSEDWTQDLAVYYANSWWSYANGHAPVLPDTLLTEDVLKERGFNIVVLGSRAKLPPLLGVFYEKVKQNRVEIVPVEEGRLMLVMKVENVDLVPFLYSLSPTSVRSVRAMPSYIEITEDVGVYGIFGLKGGLKMRTSIWRE